LKDLLVTKFIEKKVEKTKIPFIAVATNLKTGEEVRLKKGSLVNSIRASIAIPGVFTTSKVAGNHLVDGGLVNPMPVNVVRDMGADIVIAVDLNNEIAGKRPAFKSKIKKERSSSALSRKMETAFEKFEAKVSSKAEKWMKSQWPTIFDSIGNSINIMQHKITEENLLTDKADFIVRTKLGYVQLFDFHLAEQMIDHGYRETQKMIKDINKKLG